MNKRIFALSSYACGGKTSLLKALKWNLESRYPDKIFIPVTEPVTHGFNANEDLKLLVNNIDYSKDNDEIKKIISLFDSEHLIKQISFLSSSYSQMNLVEDLIKEKKYYFIFDRSPLDVFIFNTMIIYKKSNIDFSKYSVDYLADEMSRYIKVFVDKYNVLKETNYIVMRPPENRDVVKRCLKVPNRSKTINYDDFYFNSELFNEIIKRLGLNYKVFEHPSDNTYTLYKILDWVNSIIDE